MSDEPGKRFTDDEARAILARAIEIESRAPLTTMDDLRAIAADVGVSPASLEAALREETTALQSRRAAAGERAASVAAASGVPLGLAAGALLTAGTGAATLGLLALGLGGLAASGAIIAAHGAAGTLSTFHRKNLALWSGVAAGSLTSVVLMEGDVTRLPMLIAAGWSLRGWVATSILGSAAMIAVRRARRPSDTDSDAGRTDITVARGEGRWTALVKRVRGWMGEPLRRGVLREGSARRQLQSV
jgi:hypothetical protein